MSCSLLFKTVLNISGSSTLYKMLNDCAASVRKSIDGLDYFVAEGGRAFQELESVVNDLNLSDNSVKDMKASLLDAKRYLKSDFKVFMSL